MSRAKPLSRDQLAKFLPTPEAIRAFETLFRDSTDYGADILALYALVAEGEMGSAVAGAKSTQAVDAVNRLSDALELIAYAPAYHAAKGYAVKSLSASDSIGIGEFADVDASGGSVTITLPAPDGTPGAMLGVCKNDSTANSVIVSGSINGDTSAEIVVQYTALWFISTGSEWRAW